MLKLIRSTVVVLTLAGVTGFAQAQTSGGSAEGLFCLCGTTVDGSVVCWLDDLCSNTAQCDASTPCPTGLNCIINECCENSPTVGRCLATCPDGGSCNNPGVCGTFQACEGGPSAIPTVSEWGLIIMTGLLLAAGGYLIWRRNAAAPAAG